MSTTNDDISIWQSLKQGSDTAFRAIYSSNYNCLYEYGFRIVPDEEMVKDCIHDLFVKIWNNKANLGLVRSIRPYLLVSLRSIIYNRIKANNRRKLTLFDSNTEQNFAMVFSAESEYIKKEEVYQQSLLLINALNQLTSRQKEAIFLRYFAGLEYEEIADILGITVKASYKLVARALALLREQMNFTSLSAYLLLLKTACHPNPIFS